MINLRFNPRRSLRRHLILLLLGGIALIWAGVGYLVWWSALHEVEEVLDANLAQTARLLLTLAHHEMRDAHHHPQAATKTIVELDDIELLGHRYEHKIAFRILDAQGRVLLHSPNAPPEMHTAVLGAYEEQQYGNQGWRLFSLGLEDGSVQVGMLLEIRDEVVSYILQSTLWPMPFGLACVALVVGWAVGRGLRPLDRLAAELVGRSADDLHRLAQDNTPLELQPLVEALNGLLARLQQAFDNERRFTADAAHELRTPLAAIRVQAQVAQQATHDAQRDRALYQIIQGVDRATHLVEQLLTLARADAQQRSSQPHPRANLAQVAQQVVGQSAGLAIERAIDLGLDCPTPGAWWVSGDAAALAILLRNLVDNALRYTPSGGVVQVQLRTQGQTIELSVIDNGPGIPEDAQARVFERFYRHAPQSISGSGLGLSIVQRIADLHGAQIKLGSGLEGQGLQVAVWFERHPLG